MKKAIYHVIVKKGSFIITVSPPHKYDLPYQLQWPASIWRVTKRLLCEQPQYGIQCLSQMFILSQSDETSTLVKSHQPHHSNEFVLSLTMEVTDVTVKFSSVDTHCVPNFISIFVYTSWHFPQHYGVATCSIKLKIATPWCVPLFRNIYEIA